MDADNPDRRRVRAARPSLGSIRAWSAYGILALVLVAYAVSLILRSPGQSSLVLDGWMVAGFELVLSALCLARALGRHRNRAFPLVLGCGLISWSIGDILLTAESLNGATPPTPSVKDLFYLGFYPFAYAAIVVLMRRSAGKRATATWLDGAVAGLGAAAVCACFAFNSILHSAGGDALTVATNLAYPIGDVLLLALVMGGTAIFAGRNKGPWLLFAVACGVNAAGDTFNLFGSSLGSSHVGTVINGIAWPAAVGLMSVSVWLRAGRSDPLAPVSAPGFVLPGLGACAALVILFVGALHPVERIGFALATATLITAGVRLALSVRGLRALTEERHRQAVTDELTGLGNRRQLMQLLDAYFADLDSERPEQRLSFLYVDLDHFKEINDSFGHAAGDELLRQIGPRLAGSLRSADVLVRLGGDELAVVLTGPDPHYATAVASRLTAKLEEPFVLNGVTVRISASIGIAFAPEDASDSVGLLRCADLAMYRAKLGRTSSFEIYRADLDDGGNRLGLVEELRRAVNGGHLALHYQPLVDLRSGETSVVEALLRWPHPRLGLVPPLDFLPLAEEAGLMPDLTGWVLDQALAQCAAWRATGHEIAVSVNVSTSNLVDPGFVSGVADVVMRHGLPPAALILEITETTVIGDFDRCKFVIAQLRDAGYGVSIDDFGAGFTSLAYLGSLAVSELKLDRTFITALHGSHRGRELELVRATIDLGHALGLRVVAEGVEDRETLDLLAGAGCDLAQGYFIGRPRVAHDMPFRAFAEPVAALERLIAS